MNKKPLLQKLWKKIAFICWLAILIIMPRFLNKEKWISPGTIFLPISWILTAGLLIFFEKLAFRIGICCVLLFALFLSFKSQGITAFLSELNYGVQDAFFNVRGLRSKSCNVVIVKIDRKEPLTSEAWNSAIANLIGDGAKVIGIEKAGADFSTSPIIVQEAIHGVSTDQIIDLFPKLRVKKNITCADLKRSWIIRDRSGIARSYSLLIGAVEPSDASLENQDEQIKLITSWVLEMFCVGNGYNKREWKCRRGFPGLFLSKTGDDTAELFIALDNNASLPINYLGSPLDKAGEVFKIISMSEILSNQFEPGTFTEKYILIGSHDLLESEAFGTPFNAPISSIEIHATLLDNLITNTWLLNHTTKTITYTFLSILLFGTIISAMMVYTSSFLSGMTILGLFMGLPIIGYWGLTRAHILIDFAYLWLCIAQLSAILALINFFMENKERQRQFATTASK